jgi:hypothetical protein
MAPVVHTLSVAACTLLVAAAALPGAFAVAQTMPLAQSAPSGPLQLGDKPSSVTLAAPQGEPGLRERTLRSGEQLYLVLDRLRIEGDVETVYEVYFELPAGAAPARSDPHYVADFNFFDAQSGRRSASFNITELVASLQAKGALRDSPVVTIVPNGRPVGAAKPSIASIAIVARPR